jgi:hypothetical protein
MGPGTFRSNVLWLPGMGPRTALDQRHSAQDA